MNTHRDSDALKIPDPELLQSHSGTAATPLRQSAGFLGPALFWFGLFMVIPLIAMVAFSFLDWRGLTADPSFSGLENYRRFLTDPLVRAAAVNTLWHVGAGLGLMMPASFILAVFLSRKPFGYRLLAVLLFTPAIASAAARSMMFVGVFLPDGVVNALLRSVGLDALARSWLADTSTSLGSVIAVDVWAGIGFTAVLLTGAIANLSDDVIGAARIDSATDWEIMWRVQYPMTRAYVGVLTMLQFLYLLLGSAQNVLLLTRGGPGDSSTTLSFLMYDQAFVSGRLGYSQAIGVILFVIGLIGMYAIYRIFRIQEGSD